MISSIQRAGPLGAVAALLCVLGGCAVDLKDPFNDRAQLKDTQREFTQYMRWGVIEKAAQFVVPEQRAEFEALAPNLTDLRITDYETLSVEQKDETHATILVRYRGFSMSSPVERTIELHQEWSFDLEKGVWMVSIEVGKLRKALGLAAR